MSSEDQDQVYQIKKIETDDKEKKAQDSFDGREQLIRLLDASEDKNFVFLFGSPAAGKTVVLGSMIQAMQRPEVQGRLFVHGAGDGYFKYGLALWERIRTAFAEKRFPARTTKGETIQLHAQYKHPGSQDPLNLVFLEMSGEDLKSVTITDQGGRGLPFHISQFLKIPELKIAFLITTSWQDAAKDDAMIDDFLSYLNETASHLIENRIILLITKWDTYRGSGLVSIDDFVKTKMPRTYNKISDKRNVIQPFSIGKIVAFDGSGGDVISSFDYAASQRLFGRIYETFTGVSSEPPTKPKWKIW